jgi:Tfp pilus assembly protein PilF
MKKFIMLGKHYAFIQLIDITVQINEVLKTIGFVQLVEKDPDAAIVLFWKAINVGDRIDSALKDMAVVMKQQDRAEEAIEAIKAFRGRCSKQAQESLDNVLIDLYKVSTEAQNKFKVFFFYLTYC